MVVYKVLNEKFEVVKEKEIPENKLSSECWLIQFNGLIACKSCSYLNKKECGGKNIRKTLKNKKGFSIPLAE